MKKQFLWITSCDEGFNGFYNLKYNGNYKYYNKEPEKYYSWRSSMPCKSYRACVRKLNQISQDIPKGQQFNIVLVNRYKGYDIKFTLYGTKKELINE